jgi:hypothetical protein
MKKSITPESPTARPFQPRHFSVRDINTILSTWGEWIGFMSWTDNSTMRPREHVDSISVFIARAKT